MAIRGSTKKSKFEQIYDLKREIEYLRNSPGFQQRALRSSAHDRVSVRHMTRFHQICALQDRLKELELVKYRGLLTVHDEEDEVGADNKRQKLTT